jgi:hypothetical protein
MLTRSAYVTLPNGVIWLEENLKIIGVYLKTNWLNTKYFNFKKKYKITLNKYLAWQK